MADLIETARDILTPQFDAGSLETTAKAIRDSIDPGNPRSLYFNKPELAAQARAAAEARIAAAYSRSGMAEPKPMTPEEEHAAAFGMLEMNSNLKAMLDQQLEALTQTNSSDKLQAMADGLKQELGPENYNILVAQAKHAVEGELPAAVPADRLLLKSLAAQGKYLQSYEQTRPPKLT